MGQNYLPEQLVFVDESAFNRNTTKRRMAWAPVGWRAQHRDFFVRGQRCVGFSLTNDCTMVWRLGI